MERRQGFWWSPDSRIVAFTQVDVADVPLYFIPHTQSAEPAACEDHAYPFAGKANARVQLGVVSVSGEHGAGAGAVWCDCDCGGAAGRAEEEYLARVCWGPDNALWVRSIAPPPGHPTPPDPTPAAPHIPHPTTSGAFPRPKPKPLCLPPPQAQIQSRDQRSLQLVRFDLRTGARTVVLREENPVWVNLHDAFRPLCAARDAATGGALAGCFLWGSERSGFRHLYLFGPDGGMLGAVTAGDWQVDSIEGVDEDRGLVYFTGALSACPQKLSCLRPHCADAAWWIV